MPTGKPRRNTPQRKILLEELCGLNTHPTASELYEIVRKRLPRISLGTVYRNLEVLHEEGQVIKLDLAGYEARFDAIVQPHCHIRCTGCGKVRDFPEVDPRKFAMDSAEINGFLIEGFKLEYFGICPGCRVNIN
jgi:Fur family transcriptional regulator, peroxide stress response regulator